MSHGSAFLGDFSLRRTLVLIVSTVTVRKLSIHKQGPKSLLCPGPCKSLAMQSNFQYIKSPHHCFNKRTLIWDLRLAFSFHDICLLKIMLYKQHYSSETLTRLIGLLLPPSSIPQLLHGFHTVLVLQDPFNLLADF